MVEPASRRLLLACVQPDSEAQNELIATLLRQTIDWQDLFKGASFHGVAPLVAAKLRHSPAMPASARQQLERMDRVNSFRALSAAATARRALDILAGSGVQAIPWKGVALSFEAFGSITKRSSSDIDLLVRPAQLKAARSALLTAEFSLPAKARSHSEYRLSLIDQISGEVKILGPAGSPFLELHTRFLPTPEDDPRILDGMWSRASSVPAWDGKPTLLLALSDLLLTLCTHGTKHGWERLKWVCDIAALLTKKAADINWSDLLASADAYQFRGELLLGLGLAHHYLGTALPPEIAAEIDQAPALTRLIQRQESAYVSDAVPTSPIVHAFRVSFTCMPWRIKCTVAARELFMRTSRDIAEFPGPDALLPFAALLRPFRLAHKNARRGIAKLAGWRPFRLYSKWRDFNPEDRSFLLRAVFTLMLVRIGLSTCGFKRMLALSRNFPAHDSVVWGNQSPTADQCSRLVPLAARLVPGASCLAQAIAGRWLLRASGPGLEIQLGVAKVAGQFAAHAVLVQHGNILLGASQNAPFQQIFSSSAHAR